MKERIIRASKSLPKQIGIALFGVDLLMFLVAYHHDTLSLTFLKMQFFYIFAFGLFYTLITRHRILVSEEYLIYRSVIRSRKVSLSSIDSITLRGPKTYHERTHHPPTSFYVTLKGKKTPSFHFGIGFFSKEDVAFLVKFAEEFDRSKGNDLRNS